MNKPSFAHTSRLSITLHQYLTCFWAYTTVQFLEFRILRAQQHFYFFIFTPCTGYDYHMITFSIFNQSPTHAPCGKCIHHIQSKFKPAIFKDYSINPSVFHVVFSQCAMQYNRKQHCPAQRAAKTRRSINCLLF